MSKWSIASWDNHHIKRFRCTSCNGYVFFAEEQPFNYCPHCGKPKEDVKDGAWCFGSDAESATSAEPKGAMLTK